MAKSNLNKDLNKEYKIYYEKSYSKVMYTGAVGLYSRIAHYLMERPFNKGRFSSILEVGAGHGQHLPFVKCDYDSYIQSDVEVTLLKSREKSLPKNVKNLALNAEDLSKFDSNSFDRVIATCLLAHLDNPAKALQEWARVVKNNGYITIYVPTEAGILLRIVRRLIMVPKSKKFGQDHMMVVNLDHRNHYQYMRALLSNEYQDFEISKKMYPFSKLSYDFNLFEIWQIKVNK